MMTKLVCRVGDILQTWMENTMHVFSSAYINAIIMHI